MKIASEWKDFEVLATADGEKLERWKDIVLLRPDPQVIWHDVNNTIANTKIDAHYLRSNSGGGNWKILTKVPDEWVISYRNLKFSIKLMGFKHTGLFPEQAVNWDICSKLIKNANKEIKVLNLFAYTGGATVACAAAGASVTHVDCAKQMVERAKLNAKLSGLENANIRYIVDDCKKFVEREIRRGNKYDAIIMDPPSFGRSDSGVWKLETDLCDFVNLCSQILVDEPLFVLINSYSTGLTGSVMENVLKANLQGKKGKYLSYEIGLLAKDGLDLPCGNSSIFVSDIDAEI